MVPIFLLLVTIVFSACSTQKFGSISESDSSTTLQTEETQAQSTDSDEKGKDLLEMTGKMTVNGTDYKFVLNESRAAKDFAAMMPMTLDLEDYVGTEKISDLSGTLDKSDSPSGTVAKIGDITFYAPWGNLAIFYKPFHYAEGLIPLGKFVDDISFLAEERNISNAEFTMDENQ